MNELKATSFGGTSFWQAPNLSPCFLHAAVHFADSFGDGFLHTRGRYLSVFSALAAGFLVGFGVDIVVDGLTVAVVGVTVAVTDGVVELDVALTVVDGVVAVEADTVEDDVVEAEDDELVDGVAVTTKRHITSLPPTI
jgi:hypothetical protein